MNLIACLDSGIAVLVVQRDSVVDVVTVFLVTNHCMRQRGRGWVRDVIYRPGKFLVASLDKASEHNEANTLVLEDAQGRTMAMTQIAGLVARRIVCYVRSGDYASAGDRFGLIRFGSRVDLYIPTPNRIDVQPGGRVRAGTSIIGRWA